MKIKIEKINKHPWWHKFFENKHREEMIWGNINDEPRINIRTEFWCCSFPNCEYEKVIRIETVRDEK